MSDADRFWAKVDRSGDCWLWTAAVDRKGYGRFSVGGQRDAQGNRRNGMVGAHRFSCELEHGPIGDTRLWVLHRCDTPACVRPNHLFLGTPLDNVRDMDGKGRRINGQLRGTAHPNSVLTERAVREIFALYRAGGVTQAALAKKFGVCLSTVNHLFTGRLWGHLGLHKEASRC